MKTDRLDNLNAVQSINSSHGPVISRVSEEELAAAFRKFEPGIIYIKRATRADINTETLENPMSCCSREQIEEHIVRELSRERQDATLKFYNGLVQKYNLHTEFAYSD